MNIETSMIINAPHITFDDWLRDGLKVLGKVSGIVTGAVIGGGTEAADEELRKLAPAVDELAKSFHELVTPKKPKVDHKAELAKLRAMLGVPKAVKPAPEKGIEREALVDELNKIAALIGEYEPKFSPLASRLFTLSCRVHNEGVNNDESLPF